MEEQATRSSLPDTQSSQLSLSPELKIAAINVNSLIAHSRRLETYEFIKKNNLDVLLLSETKLSNRYNVQFTEYNIIRTDRPDSLKGGGTAIIIKKNIPHQQVFTPSSLRNEVLEYTIIKIPLHQNKILFVISIYANNKEKASFSNELNNLFEKLNLNSDRNFFILAGDFNARNTCWEERVTNFKGRLLKKWEDNFGHVFKATIILPDSPTFTPSNTFIDFYILDIRLKITNVNNNKIKTADFESDHKAILCTINLSSLKIDSSDYTFTHRYMFKSTKWNKFSKHLSENTTISVPNNRNLTIEEIDTTLEHINSDIFKSIEAAVPRYKPVNNTLYYVNSKIKKLRKQKSAVLTILNTYKYSHHNNLKLLAKNLLDSINLKLKQEFRKSYTNYWQAQYKTINHRKTESFFPKINKWFRPKEDIEVKTLIIQPSDSYLLKNCNVQELAKDNDNYIIDTPHDKLNIMGTFYERINSVKNINKNTKTKESVSKFIDKYKTELELRKISQLTLTNFSSDNPANNPNPTDNLEGP